ncbi:MAG: hypothetical protein WKG03_00475 [Telluria sp.]
MSNHMERGECDECGGELEEGQSSGTCGCVDEARAERERRQNRPTNTEFVHDMMEYSKCGAMAQVLILQAIAQFAHKVAAMEPKEIESGFISAQAWIAAGKEISAKMKARGL